MDLFRKPKKRNAPAMARKRESSGDEGEAEIIEVVRKRGRKNPMVQSTKKHGRIMEGSSSDDSDSQDAATVTHSFSATGDAGPSGPRDQGATATLDIDTDHSADAQAQFERVQRQLKEGVEKDGKVLYKGAALYGAREAKDTAKGNASSGMNRVGPVRAPQFLRQTVRWDFAPDICKDYKETGNCTFGDSCKFVHDRSDYKHGWEIDEEFEAGKYGEDDATNYEIRDEEDSFPDDCFICGNSFVDPIVTKCKHYFCSGCALKTFRKSPKCPVCNQNTENIMNAARDLLNYIKKKNTQVDEKNDSEDDVVETMPTEQDEEEQEQEYVADASEEVEEKEEEILMEEIDDDEDGCEEDNNVSSEEDENDE